MPQNAIHNDVSISITTTTTTNKWLLQGQKDNTHAIQKYHCDQYTVIALLVGEGSLCPGQRLVYRCIHGHSMLKLCLWALPALCAFRHRDCDNCTWFFCIQQGSLPCNSAQDQIFTAVSYPCFLRNVFH